MVFYNISFFLSLRNIISGKCAKNTRTLRRSNKPSIITFLHDIHYVTLLKLNFIIVLRGIVVKCPVPKTNYIVSSYQSNLYLVDIDVYTKRLLLKYLRHGFSFRLYLNGRRRALLLLRACHGRRHHT